ncbi:MAG: hypothetical protein KC656_21320, partial [Myxococcales bacterium]|nr:hypothetical protein [Myxococcales bacterium]
GGLGDLGGLGNLGALGELGGWGGGIGYDDGPYIGFYQDRVQGSWSQEDFFVALETARPALQSCWRDQGLGTLAVSYLVTFTLEEGALAVTGIEQTYAADGATHADAEACVRSGLPSASFPSTYTGTYTYALDVY